MNKTPKLRFKEFSGEWDVKKLEELTNYVDYRGKTPTKSESGIFLVTAKNIKKGYIDYAASQEFISKESYDEAMRRGLPKKGDVLLTTEAPLGNVAQIDREDVALAQRVIKFRGTDELNNTYLKYYFLSERFQNKLFSKAIGTTVLGIQGKVLHKMPVTFSSKEEQEKIASFISLIDDKISLQGEKVEALKDYKKGMMQKLFSRELRFKDDDGRDYPDWIPCKIGNCFSERSERGFEDLELLSVSMQNGVMRRSDIEGKDNSSENKSNYKLVKEDDIVYNSMRMWQGASGLSEFEGIVSPAYTVLTPKHGVYSRYFSYLFKMEKIIYEFRKYSQGLTSDTWNLKYPQIKDIKVMLPSYNEQVKIAKVLEFIDLKIEKNQEKLEYLNEYKKGLLQQMFV